MAVPAPERIDSLDLIRGIAVLGILAINISGFAGPVPAITNPNFPDAGSLADRLAFSFSFVLFEGKMRALFTILFGASLVLFVERADANGRFGDLLQLRRLLWLALFGLLHFYFIWWGDILFLYATCGVIALMMHRLPVRLLVPGALAFFAVWHAAFAAHDAPPVIAEQHVLAGTASPAEIEDMVSHDAAAGLQAEQEHALAHEGFLALAAYQLGEQTLFPFGAVIQSFGETLPLMLIGIALVRSGFFAGSWPKRRMVWLAAGALATGLALTCAMLGWAWAHEFPPRAMRSAVFTWMAIPHLLMATGYAAVLVMAAPTLTGTALGKRFTAAGRMAFSNYIGTSIVMTGIFYGWGLGLFGTAGHAGQWLYVLFGWVLMLAWSEPWLKRYRRGPLEWLWRSLTEGHAISFVR